MFFLYKLVGSLVVIPGFFIALLLVCAVLAFHRPARRGLGFLLLLLAVGLWFLSCDLGSLCILGPLESMYREELPPDGGVTVLVLCGGNEFNDEGAPVQPGQGALERAYLAAKLLNERGGVMVVSGGRVFGYEKRSEASLMAEAARRMGWRGKTLLEEKSRNTKENFIYSAEILHKLSADDKVAKAKEVVLVTSAFHMPRAMKFAARYLKDVKIYPCPCPRTTDTVFHGFPSLLPNGGALHGSCIAAKEWVGLLAAGL